MQTKFIGPSAFGKQQQFRNFHQEFSPIVQFAKVTNQKNAQVRQKIQEV